MSFIDGTLNLQRSFAQEVGQAVGEAAEAVTGSKTVAHDAQEVAQIAAWNLGDPESTLIDLGGKTLGLNETQRGAAKIVTGFATQDCWAWMNGVRDVVDGLGHGESFFAAPGSHPSPDGADASASGYAPASQATGASSADGATPPGGMGYAQAIGTIRDHFDTVDTAAGIGGRDGLIGKCDLEAVLDDPDAPADLKAACKFMVENPVYWNQADVGSGVGQVDGLISKGDLDAEIAQHPVTASASSATGSDAASDATGSTTSADKSDSASAADGSSSDISGIMSDPSLSLDEKVALVLAEIEKKLAKEIDGDLKKLTDKNGKVDPKVQQQLQMAMNAKNELEQMASNVTKMEHETRSQIIGNIR